MARKGVKCTLTRETRQTFGEVITIKTFPDAKKTFVKMKSSDIGKRLYAIFVFSNLLPSGSAITQAPRSCEQSLAFGNNYTGLHKLQSLDGSSYEAFCQFDPLTRTGLTFVSKFAVHYYTLDIDLMFTDREYAVVRFLMDNDTQTETVVRQLSQYQTTSLSIQQNTWTNYTEPVNTAVFGNKFLFLGFLDYDQANKTGMEQGWMSNGQELKFNNCDANPNSYMVFYADLNVSYKAASSRYAIVPLYLETRIPTRQKHYLSPIDIFNYTEEMHFGGCGALDNSCSWDVKGTALGIPFKSIPCPEPPCILFATRSSQSVYYPGDKAIYSCIQGYRNTSSTYVRCGIQGQWIDAWPTCIREKTSLIHSDVYRYLKDPLLLSCPWDISELIPQTNNIECAKICSKLPQCMMYATDGGDCIITNGVKSSTKTMSKYAQWYIQQ